MNTLLLKMGVVAASAALACCTLGCSVQAADNNSEESASSEQTKAVQYFEQCTELPTPDSIIDATESSTISSSTDGIETSTEYSYKLNEDDSEAAASQAQSYADSLSDYGFQAIKDSETEWTVVKDSTNMGTISYDPSDMTLKVEVYAEGSRTTLESISLGQTVEADNYTFTLTNVEWGKELYPPNTSGGYNYYQEQPNKTYCVVKGTFKNTGSNAFDLGSTSLEFKNMNGKYNFSGSPEYAFYNAVGYNSLGNFYSIEPLTEVPVYLYASVPDEVADYFTGGTMTWTFRDGSTYSLTFE